MIYNVKKQKNKIFKNVSASIHSPSSVLKISKNKLFSYKKKERKNHVLIITIVTQPNKNHPLLS